MPVPYGPVWVRRLLHCTDVQTALKREGSHMEACLQVKNISKVFPGVKALTDLSVDFYPGEAHALVGENGAGKSTLI